MLPRLSMINYLLFVLCTAFALQCAAIGFGDIKVYSYLDEQLKAEIPVTDVGDLDPNQLLISLADPNEFVRAGLDRPYFLTTLNFQMTNYKGQSLIYITSSKLVKEPYLEFLMEIAWPTGKMIKHITILIDPPPPNLKAQNRKTSFSDQAIKEQEVKQFGLDKAADSKEKEQKKQSQSENKHLTKFSDQTLVDAWGLNQPYVPAPPQSPAAAPATAPTSATITTTQTTQITRGAEPASVAASPQAQVTPQPAQPVIAPNAVIHTPSIAPATSQVTTSQNTTPGVSKNTNFFDEAIKELREVDTQLDATVDMQHLTTERKKHSDMFKEDTEAQNPEIDFGEVIKPNAGATADQVGAAKLPGGKTIPPGLGEQAGATAPKLPTEPPNTSHNGFYLILAGFLLGISAAVAFAIKKGLHRKYLAKLHLTPDDNGEFVVQDYDKIPLDLSNAKPFDTEKYEEIDIGAALQTAPKKQIEDLDLDKFEEELNALEKGGNLNPTESNTPKTLSKSMSDLLNIQIPSGSKPQTAVAKPELKAKAEPELKSEPEPEIKTELKLAPAMPEKALGTPTEDLPIIDLKPAIPQPEVHIEEDIETIHLGTVTERVTPKPETAPQVKSELRLEEQPAAQLTVDEQAIKLKLELAKKYLEAGDKESAKGILSEVIEVAKDTQKIEAEVMLSGIL